MSLENSQVDDEDDKLTRALERDRQDRLLHGGGYKRPRDIFPQKLSGRGELPEMIIPEKRREIIDVSAVMEPPGQASPVTEPGQKPEPQE